MRKISEIIVHCAATPEGKAFTVADIDAWHKKRGFRCIGANGICIFIPCHRVIGSNHSLTGFAGGLDAKRRLFPSL